MTSSASCVVCEGHRLFTRSALDKRNRLNCGRQRRAVRSSPLVAHEVLPDMANPARISSMIGPDFPPSPKEGAWLAVCVGVLGSH